MILTLTPKMIDESTMIELEGLGLIKRLLPEAGKNPDLQGHTADDDSDRAMLKAETNRVEICYATEPEYGGHKLIHVTINSSYLTRLISHPGHEEFLLLGPTEATPLVLVISKHQHAILEEKFKDGSATAEDFVCFYCKMNDPRLSFFTMHSGFPHAEVCQVASDRPPSFFVTESKDLPEIFLELEEHSIILAHHHLSSSDRRSI